MHKLYTVCIQKGLLSAILSWANYYGHGRIHGGKLSTQFNRQARTSKVKLIQASPETEQKNLADRHLCGIHSSQMTSLCKKESICAVHEKQTQAKQLSVKQHVRQHGARLQVTDSDGITMRKRVATQPETSPRGSMHCPMGLQSRTTNHSPCALELSSEPTRRVLELSENYMHKVRCVAGGFECELLHIKAHPIMYML